MSKITANGQEFNSQEALDKYLQDQAAELAKMQEALEKASPIVASEDIVVKNGSDSYKFLVGKFTLPGEEPVEYTAEEAAKDKTLIKKLVDLKSGILQKI